MSPIISHMHISPNIRAAKTHEAAHLSEISLQSKKYWHYPDEYFQIWADELRVSPEYIKDNVVFVFEMEGVVVGYYSVVEMVEDRIISGIEITQGFWLDHMFILPEYIASGIGKEMFVHLHGWCQANGVVKLKILADPNARGFYEKMGCSYEKDYPSTIPGRTTPLLTLSI